MHRAAVVFLVGILACGDDDAGGADGGRDAAAPDAPGVDAPGVDAPAADAPSVDAPGTDAGRDAGGPPPATACDYADPAGAVFYVATDGDDGGDGSEGAPWATITHALDSVPDGATILVRPGTYRGRIRMRGSFASGVTVRSEVPYMAKLRNDDTVMTFYEAGPGCEGITLEGFDIAHEGPGAGALVVHLDGGGSNAVSRITLRNNVMHDSFDNDVLKINNGIADITVERNLFFNQTGSDEHIDINSAERIVVQDNVFLNAFEASGRTFAGETSSYIVVKDSNGSSDVYTGSRDITIRRNVFMSWQGNGGSGFLLFGEDGQPFAEVDGALVENNLFVGDSDVLMRAPFGIKGARNITFRNNSTFGDLPSRALMRFNLEGDNPGIVGVVLANNLWTDATGTLGAMDGGDAPDFADAAPDAVTGTVLTHNQVHNGGDALPTRGGEAFGPEDDAALVTGDPGLGAIAGLVTPHFDGTAFADGSRSICEAFERIVMDYATPAAASPGVDAGDPATSARDDILGRPRDATPDIGAVER